MARPKSAQKPIEILVQGIVYKTPVCPPISQIRVSDLPKHDQVWHRDLTYQKFDWELPQIKWTPEQNKWLEEEIERLHVGTWIMINGTPTYFNNWCYFFHQWFVLQEGIYPQYKETSLEYFYFFELTENDPVHVGEIGIKGRRVGLSSMSASIKLLIALIESNTLSGIISKTEVDAQEMFFFVKNGLENLPKFLMPELKKVTEGEIHIAKKAPSNTTVSADKGKNNRIDYRATSENAYDQSRKRHMTIDEAAKWIKVNVVMFLSKVLETVYVGTSLVGHISVFSSVNKGDQGGDNFRILWDGSDHINGKKDAFGRTKTRLMRFFFAGYRGLMGYVGKYGESIIDTPTKAQTEYLKTVVDPTTGKLACPNPYIGAKEYLQATRDMLENDPEELAEQIRKYPFTWQEVFKGANNKCNFILEDLNNQIEAIEAHLQNIGQKENGRRGRFYKSSNGEKKFEDSNEGMWYILEFLEPGSDNKYHYNGSIKCPGNGRYGAAGLDPFAHSKIAVEDGSDACIMVMKRYDVMNPETSYLPVAMFIGRPKRKEDFFDQLYWGLEYYGIKVLGERAPTDWIDYAKKKTIRLATEDEDAPKKVGYLMCTKRANGSEVYGINPQDKEAREQHLTEMVEYAQHNMKKIKFLRLLKDMLKFDIDDRTAFDACMAWGYSLIGLNDWKQIEKIEITARQFMKNKRSKTYY